MPCCICYKNIFPGIEFTAVFFNYCVRINAMIKNSTPCRKKKENEY